MERRRSEMLVRSLPRRLWRKAKRGLALARNFYLDYRRYSAHGCPDRKFRNPAQREAYILMLAHGVEKGLAFEDRRKWFGEAKLRDLMSQCRAYRSETSETWVLKLSCAVVRSYLDCHTEVAAENDDLCRSLGDFLSEFDFQDEAVLGGTKTVRPASGSAPGQVDPIEFFRSRSSVRSFSSRAVERRKIELAVRSAQCSPSVCNRQAARVHVLSGDVIRRAALSCQNGNAGFGHMADKVLAVTVDLRCFLSPGERNQAWIDGGLFAMTLLWALHGQGVGSCSLNWSAEHDQDRLLRQVVPLEENEVVIMMMAVGYAPESVRVPQSQRRPLSTVMKWHQ